MTVTQVNQAPVAAFGESCDELACSFDAAGSSDPEGDTLSYAWDFGDGETGTGVSPAHSYSASGTYTATLTVSDGSLSDEASHAVIVTQALVEHVARASAARNSTTHVVTVPASVEAGDTLLLFLTANVSTTTITPLAGWTAGPGGGRQRRSWSGLDPDGDGRRRRCRHHRGDQPADEGNRHGQRLPQPGGSGLSDRVDLGKERLLGVVGDDAPRAGRRCPRLGGQLLVREVIDRPSHVDPSRWRPGAIGCGRDRQRQGELSRGRLRGSRGRGPRGQPDRDPEHRGEPRGCVSVVIAPQFGSQPPVGAGESVVGEV